MKSHSIAHIDAHTQSKATIAARRQTLYAQKETENRMYNCGNFARTIKFARSYAQNPENPLEHLKAPLHGHNTHIHI